MNIVNILKDVPKGTKLYSPICGELTFKCVYDCNYPIRCAKGNKDYVFTKEGKYFEDYPDAECLIFPDKTKSWKNWKDKLLYKKGNIVKGLAGVLYLVAFCDKEFIYVKTWDDEIACYFRENTLLTFASESETQKFHQKLKENGYKWDGENIVKIDRYEALVEKLDEKCPCWRECIKED